MEGVERLLVYMRAEGLASTSLAYMVPEKLQNLYYTSVLMTQAFPIFSLRSLPMSLSKAEKVSTRILSFYEYLRRLLVQ